MAFSPRRATIGEVKSRASTSFDRHRAAVRARLGQPGIRRPTPDSVTWRVNQEIVVIAGWGRAILLQFAHPLIAAGVHDHSSFRAGLSSSLQRLRATVEAMLSLTFGNDDEVVDAAAAINTIHDRVFGRLTHPGGNLPAGTEYSAHDPELLRWVHATLLESIPLTYELLVGPLSREERDRYCAETAINEELLDIPRGSLPRSTIELETYMQAMAGSGQIAVTDTSRTLAHAMLWPPRSIVLWPAFRALRLITLGSLPPPIREAYGFSWGPREERAFVRWTGAIRWACRHSPHWLRDWPLARRRAASAAARRRWRAAEETTAN